MPALPRQAAAPRSAVGHVRRPRHRRDLAPAAQAARRHAAPYCRRHAPERTKIATQHPEKAIVTQRIAEDLRRAARTSCSTSASAISRSSAARRRFRPASCSACGSRRRSAPTCSASSTCSTSRRPACIPPTPRRCSRALDQLKAAGNSLFVVEHELDVIRHADWIVDVGPAAGEHGGGPLQRPARRAAARRGIADRGAISSASTRIPRTDAARRRTAGCELQRRHAQQSARPRRRASRSACSRPSPASRARASRASSARCSSSSSPSALGHEVAVDDDEGEELERRTGRATGGRIAGGHGSDQAPRARRSEADRPHAALEPRDLHRPVRPRAQALRRDQGGARAPLRRRPLLVQRRQGPLRDLRGRRLRHGRAAVPAERLRAVPDLPRRALQRQDARDQATAARTSPTCWP